MANFDLYAPALLSWEGGFAIVEGDTGGPTNLGVTIETFRLYINKYATIDDLRNMTDAQWRRIAKGEFWDKIGGDDITNQSVAELIMDWCYHSGLGTIKKIQGIVGTKTDGVVGPKTIAAINGWNQKRLHFTIKAARAEHMATIIKRQSFKLKFYDGWIRRLASLMYGKTMLKADVWK